VGDELRKDLAIELLNEFLRNEKNIQSSYEGIFTPGAKKPEEENDMNVANKRLLEEEPKEEANLKRPQPQGNRKSVVPPKG